MKSIQTCLLLSLSIFIITLSACSKKGDTGPQGPAGNAGATGATGATGYSVPVIVEDFGVGPTDWQHTGTAGSAGAHDYYYHTSSNLTTDVMNGGAVLLYQQTTVNSSTGYSAVPNSFYTTSGRMVSVRFAYTTHELDVQYYLDDFSFATFSSAVNFRMVVIPNVGKTSWPVDLTDYQAVKKYFHLKD